MSTSNRDEGGSPSRAPPPVAQDAGKPSAAPSPQHLTNLQNEMLSAVRGAITGVMAKGATAAEMPELDLDFSVGTVANANRLPVLRAEPERSLAVQDRVPTPMPRNLTVISAAAGIAVVGLAGGFFFANWHSASPPAPVSQDIATAPVAPLSRAAPVKAVAPVEPAKPQPPAPPIVAHDALDAANALIQDGRIAEARKSLLAAPPPERSAVALLLARTYDPNFLSTLSISDGKPDLDEARRWYRHWYELAVKEGAVPQSMRLDLLLRSLDRAAGQ